VVARFVRSSWSDPFVNEWKVFHQNLTRNQAFETDPAGFLQDLELLAGMVESMGEP
jgi:hypothetical protein